MCISFWHDAVLPVIAFQNPKNPGVKRAFNSYKAHIEMSVSLKCRVHCPTSPDHSENFRVINNHNFKYLWVHGGYKNISSRSVSISTRQDLFRSINEEMGLAFLHFSQKGKYRVWHDAVANCSRLLLQSITLPWKPDFFFCLPRSVLPDHKWWKRQDEGRTLMNTVQDRSVKEMGPTSAHGTRTWHRRRLRRSHLSLK